MDKNLKSTIIEATRILHALRAEKRRYVTPRKWAQTEHTRSTDHLHHHPQRTTVNPESVRVASQWAVAHTYRDQQPHVAERYDAALRQREVDVAELRHEVDALRAENYARPSPGNTGVNIVGAATSAALTTSFLAHADTWLDDLPDSSFAPALESWETVLDTPADADVTADVPEAAPSVDQADLLVHDQPTGLELVPEGTFPYTIDEQLAFVEAHGTHADIDASSSVDVGAEPTVDAGLGLG
ncbi:hypothetical protein [Corynebacterium auriscanis]|uniref:hypothetical protein n=1 Tax=Corynebacterium auriscanis TaxID=99807 RepID=UPI003CEB65B9